MRRDDVWMNVTGSLDLGRCGIATGDEVSVRVANCRNATSKSLCWACARSIRRWIVGGKENRERIETHQGDFTCVQDQNHA